MHPDGAKEAKPGNPEQQYMPTEADVPDVDFLSNHVQHRLPNHAEEEEPQEEGVPVEAEASEVAGVFLGRGVPEMEWDAVEVQEEVCLAVKGQQQRRHEHGSSALARLLPPRTGARIQRVAPPGQPVRYQVWYPRNPGDIHESTSSQGAPNSLDQCLQWAWERHAVWQRLQEAGA